MPTLAQFLNRGGKRLREWVGLGGAEGKARAQAESWLELADKVWAFRRDVLPEREAAELRTRTEELRQRYQARATVAQLQQGMDGLEPVLKRNGGAIYPKTALVENVEFFLVAAIVIIGVRSYFVQPFKIPTNSMWPSYYGMTGEIYASKAEEPGPLAVAARTVAYGAWAHRLDAPGDGEVLIPIGGEDNRGYVHYRVVPGHTWLVIPTQLKEYTLFVDDRPVKVRVPLDFDFDWVIGDAFFATGKPFSKSGLGEHLQALVTAGRTEVRYLDGQPVRCIRTGRKVLAGDRVLAFDEITGDQLFVDRVTYHFMRPRVGQGFVFYTGNIRNEYMQDLAGNQIVAYYIKRLIGTPGDVIQIREPVIYRNGRPITGADAFEKNARREGLYGGYFYGPRIRGNLMSADQELKVPANAFFAMGDNSANSADGRYWGFVPAKDVIGRPLFIYFPFSKRWGPSR